MPETNNLDIFIGGGDRLTRRSLLRQATLATAATALGAAASPLLTTPASAAETLATATENRYPRLRGVNLGGWFVLEKWLESSVFRGLTATDEYTYGQELGPQEARARLTAHRESWITEADFAWIAKTGLNAVRIPVGYWVLDAPAPYVSGRETLDKAFQWANKHNLKIALDLHGAPGSQNGWDHSGRAGEMNWPKDPKYQKQSLDVIESFAIRYGKEPSLAAIELLNEPRWDEPLPILKQYYLDGYARVRKHCPADKVAVMFHDSFRSMDWQGFMNGPEYKNVILDTHQYQCFTDGDKKLDLAGHLHKASVEWSELIDKMQRELPVNVGEWSLALTPETFAGLSDAEKDKAKRDYANAQLHSFEKAQRGWFFWTYKTEHIPEWSFRESVERGWFPERFV